MKTVTEPEFDNTDLTKNNWYSLTQLKEYLERKFPNEEIVSFDGLCLITTKYRYGLGPDGLSINPV
jgi:hypothetical protein